jgi:hypothetical protein
VGFLTLAPCWSHKFSPAVCSPELGTFASFLTVIGADGTPAVLHQPVPIPAADQLVWDGEHFVALAFDQNQMFFFLSVFDRTGTLVRVAAVGPELATPSYKRLFHAKMVAVAPNDYIMVYSAVDLSATFTTRFSLVPL